MPSAAGAARQCPLHSTLGNIQAGLPCSAAQAGACLTTWGSRTFASAPLTPAKAKSWPRQQLPDQSRRPLPSGLALSPGSHAEQLPCLHTAVQSCAGNMQDNADSVTDDFVTNRV